MFRARHAQPSLVNGVKTSLSCCVTLMKVVLLESSFSFDAPTYVHVERTPPRMSCIVASTGPRYAISTVFPSDALKTNHEFPSACVCSCLPASTAQATHRQPQNWLQKCLHTQQPDTVQRKQGFSEPDEVLTCTQPHRRRTSSWPSPTPSRRMFSTCARSSR